MAKIHLQGLLTTVLLVLSEFGTKPVLALELSEVCRGGTIVPGASQEALHFFENQTLLHVNYCFCLATSINGNGSKLLAIFKSYETHTSAQGACQSRGSNLAKLESSADGNLMKCLMRQEVFFGSRQLWIGLKCEDGASCTESSSYKWIDGSSLTWDNWKNNQPDNQIEGCVETTSSGWNNVRCTSKYYYSCYKDLQSTTTTPTMAATTTTASTTATQTKTESQTKETPTTTTPTATLLIITNITTTETTTDTKMIPSIVTTETTYTNFTDTLLGTTLRAMSQSTSSRSNRQQSGMTSAISATKKTSKPALAETHTTAGGIFVASGYCCQWEVQSTRKASVEPGETLQQTLGSGGQILMELDSPVGFNLTLQTLKLKTSVFSPTKNSELTISGQIPVGIALEILPEVSQSNVTVRFGIKVNAAEAQHAIATINDKNGGRFRLESATYLCVFLNESSGELSSYGMTNLGVDEEGRVRCKSNHTTIFAVLLSVTGRLVPASAKALTYVCGTVSILSLLLTLTVLIAARKRRGNERSVVQINLAIALLLFHVFNLVHDAALQSRTFCEVTALVLHFFILSSGPMRPNARETIYGKAHRKKNQQRDEKELAITIIKIKN